MRARLHATLILFIAGPALAQGTAESRRIEGQLTRATGAGRSAPLAGAWVILHRVGTDQAAPLDSMRTRADGSYAFRYRATGDSTAIYFVSTVRGGVAYFAPPTREGVVRGGDADLMVFDTTSAPLPVTLRGRHLIVTSPERASPDVRTVIEVYELSNDSARTRVPGASGRSTFEAPLPAGVTSVRGGEGDVSPDAMRVEEGRLRIYAPIAPGLKQFSFLYDLPARAELAYPIAEAVPVLEVLVEDARGTAVGADLIEVSSVQVEGRPFRRFLAQDVVAPTVVDITAPGPGADRRTLRLMLILTGIGAAILFALGASVLRRGPGALARRPTGDPEALAVVIAALDARFAALASPTDAERAEHHVERARLKGQLHAALAKRDGLA
jgi:hypothetical protein